jgi:hypothetical protein
MARSDSRSADRFATSCHFCARGRPLDLLQSHAAPRCHSASSYQQAPWAGRRDNQHRDKRPTVLGIAAEGLSRAANGHLCARARCLFIVQSCNAEPPGSLTYTRVLGNECSREECDGQPISFIRTSVRAGRAARVRRSQCVRGWLLRTVWRPRVSCRVAGRQSIQ